MKHNKLKAYSLILLMAFMGSFSSLLYADSIGSPINTGVSGEYAASKYEQVKRKIFRSSNLYYIQNMSATFSKYKMVNVKVDGLDAYKQSVGYTMTTEVGTSIFNFISLAAFAKLGNETAKDDQFMHFNNVSLGAKFDFYLQNPLVNVVLNGAGLVNTLSFKSDRKAQRLYGFGGLVGIALQRTLTKSTSVLLGYEYIQSSLTGTIGKRAVVDSVMAEGENFGLGLLILF